MKEIISEIFNRKQTIQKYFNNKKIIKDKNNNLTVFEPKLHIRVHPKTDAIPLNGQTVRIISVI